MKKLLIPLVMALVGTGAGVGAGIMLGAQPKDDEAHAAEAEAEHDAHGSDDEHASSDDSHGGDATGLDYAKLANQFVIPVIADERISAMVVVTLSIAVEPGQTDIVYEIEPKLRDGLLQVMFNHSNIGGFSGNFTSTSNMRTLRTDLLRSAQNVMGSAVKDVLILDIVRQDL